MSRVVVTVDIDELTALRGAVNRLAAAIEAITPTAGDEVQTEAVVNARCALLAALKARFKGRRALFSLIKALFSCCASHSLLSPLKVRAGQLAL